MIGGPVQVIGDDLTSVRIEASGASLVVTFSNAVAPVYDVEPWVLSIGGIEVTGTINSREGSQPDDLVVVPPPGFYCDPCVQTVDETGEGQVVLYPEVAA